MATKDKPQLTEDGTIITIVRDKNGNEIGVDITLADSE